MITALAAALLIAHGLLHLSVWLPAQPGRVEPFNPRRSWALAAAHVAHFPAAAVSVAFASDTAILYVLAGAGLAVGAGWWSMAALVAASWGLVLKAIWFHPWLTVGALLDAAVVLAVAQSWPGSLY
ncbi:hypothetical protein [Streptomyces sp. NBC_01262]|uniref:hypothetical protein n=1 Tax=Streptomyces sp. NBC_01262 TaxID=2903803 RepID=UPI002E36B460|nr:hypothetical protein [Streptomyces sp. NBC_01262]